MNMSRLVVVLVFAVGLMMQSDVTAQAPFSNLCQTALGICPVNPAPVGSGCSCGRDPGRIVLPPPNMSNACGTGRGVCRVDYGPVGSPCMCGGDYGQRIYMR